MERVKLESKSSASFLSLIVRRSVVMAIFVTGAVISVLFVDVSVLWLLAPMLTTAGAILLLVTERRARRSRLTVTIVLAWVVLAWWIAISYPVTAVRA